MCLFEIIILSYKKPKSYTSKVLLNSIFIHMDLKVINTLYDKLLKDEDFDKLDLGLKNPNIFQILRIT